jgi:hypothetical protein
MEVQEKTQSLKECISQQALLIATLDVGEVVFHLVCAIAAHHSTATIARPTLPQLATRIPSSTITGAPLSSIYVRASFEAGAIKHSANNCPGIFIYAKPSLCCKNKVLYGRRFCLVLCAALRRVIYFVSG